ncbi:MAG: lipid-A-disaccharide synthase [Xanthomonadaceae bacterium]|nr:lipid-A-disaccharide synthase [Xanthomonadaceae bacterium]
MKNSNRHLWVSAFEQSSDQYLSGILKELATRDSSLKISGIGGKESRAAGLQPLFNAEELSIMGLVEIIRSLPKVYLKLREIKKFLRTNPPDVALLIDYPGLHFALLPTLRKCGSRIIYFIPPKVWVWRKKRIQILKKYVDQVLCIFPFEKEFFEKEGLAVQYVGNPLLDQLPSGDMNNATGKKQLAVLPGSRRQEIEFHLELMSETSARFEKQTGAQVNFSFPNQFSETQRKIWSDRIKQIVPNAEICWGNSHAIMRSADYGLIKSGTSTLEAALLGLRHIVVYKLNPITCFILLHVLKIKQFAGLSNIILDYEAKNPPHFKELLCSDATVEKCMNALQELHDSEKLKSSQSNAIHLIREKMKVNASPTQLVADSMIAELEIGRASVQSFSIIKYLSAHLWNAIHQFRLVFARPEKLPAKVISVGNYQMGGTGKTPFVLELLSEAEKRKKSVWVLTRGYRSSSEENGWVVTPGMSGLTIEQVGDEALMIHNKFPQVPLGIGRNRLESFASLKQKLGRVPDWVILDDGAQNLQIQKDLEIILMTSDRVGEAWYREIPGAVMKANELRIWTKGNFSTREPMRVKIQTVFKQSIPAKPLYLVSGIAKPDQLKDSLDKLGIKIGHHEIFRDHSTWSPELMKNLLIQSEKKGFALAMTEKDFVRVSDDSIKKQIWVVDSEINWLSGRSNLERSLD